MIMVEEIKNKLSKVNYVSFDVFSTLIFRTTKRPEDIFSIVEYRYNSTHSDKINDFRYTRIMSERLARDSRTSEDILLDAIYSKMPYSEGQRKELQDLEELLEVENCVPNRFMMEVVDYCRKEGKKIVITTDMYLSSKVISGILNKIGVKYDYLFVSGEVGKTKKSGTLFKHVLDELGIAPTDVIHMGDSIHSDIKMANKNGIEAIETPFLPKKYEYAISNPDYSLSVNQMESLIDDEFGMTTKLTSAKKLGYGVIGPVMFAYCRWVHDKKELLKFDELCFVAREGYLIQKCYEAMYPEEKDIIHYIRINKNVMRTPMLMALKSIQEMYDSLPVFNEYKWGQILSSFGINNDETVNLIKDKISDYSADKTVTRTDIYSGKYETVFTVLKETLLNRANEQADLLKNYLYQNNLQGKKVGMVNNSINGVAQNQLANISSQIGIDTDIYGLQFVHSDTCKATLGDKVYAWLNEANIPLHYINDFRRNSLLFEHMLFENEGTALNFATEDGKVIVKCADVGMEASNEIIVAEVQEYAIKFCSDYMSVNGVLPEADVIKKLMMFSKTPSAEDCKFVAQIVDDDIDGVKSMIRDDVSYSSKFVLGGKKIPSSIKWIEGYFVNKGQGNLGIYDAINAFRDNKFSPKKWISLCKFNRAISSSNRIEKKHLWFYILRRLNYYTWDRPKA